jgi:hypothetical protein
MPSWAPMNQHLYQILWGDLRPSALDQPDFLTPCMCAASLRYRVRSHVLWDVWELLCAAC